ncbi:MAG TPA: aldose 1-epimerase [Thermoleophilaceae bacterium]|nr:aldose 1-epimerase [Thermoleophilaceae bacterium]
MAHTISDTTIDGFPAVVLSSGSLDAAFAPGVGMIGCSLRHGGEELLGQRNGLRAYADTGSSMGIPLLHPWANRLDGLRYPARGGDTVRLDPERSPLRLDANGLPIHGVLAASPHWTVVERAATGEAAVLVALLDFGARPELLEAFPFPHVVTVTVTLENTRLTIRTALRATGVMPLPVAFGYHPYLRLPGLERARWQVALPVRERALLDERGIPTGRTEAPAFTGGELGEVDLDDLYPALDEHPRFGLEGGGRRIEVAFEEGYPVAQVYGGPADEFICFEPMTAPTNALVTGDGLRHVEPGGGFEASFAISVAEV